MYFFSFEAKPKPDHPEAGEVEGAFVDCWLDGDDAREEERRAREIIDERGWEITSKEDERVVSGEDYADDPDGLRFFRDAEANGACLVFEAWLAEGVDVEDAVESAGEDDADDPAS
jgi:hypothetical protein